MRWRAGLLTVATIFASWLGMQAVHEAGHVLGASLTGGQVERVVLHPLTISRTDLSKNPHPLLVTWAGPVFGSIAPVLIWLLFRRSDLGFLLRFFAGFCLVANGLYLGIGSLDGVGDAGDLLRNGARSWQLWAFGVLTVLPGLWLWHGLGADFGVGTRAKTIPTKALLFALGACLLLLTAGLAVGER
jgi:hypothetical protein